MKKNGFTLIELLAVIILIAVIAVITIPKINDTIDKSKIGIAKDSAYGYIKAVDDYYYHQTMNKEKIKLEGTYLVNESGILFNNKDEHSIKFNGTSPKNGYLNYVDSELDSGCLTVDKYQIIFENGEINTVVKGQCETIKLPPLVAQTIDGVDYYDALYVKKNPVYYNPVTGEKCSQNDYFENNSLPGYNGIDPLENQSTCLKWYAYSKSDDGVNMILDHNTSTGIKWNEIQESRRRPDILLDQLVDDTSGWNSEVLERNDSYTPEMWIGGLNEWTADYSGYNARIITANEIANIARASNTNSSKLVFDETTATTSNWFYFDGTGSDWKTKNSSSKNASNFSWLFDNLENCENYGCNIQRDLSEDGNSGYWTISPTKDILKIVWVVSYDGTLRTTILSASHDGDGIRPVITVPETVIAE